VSFSSAVTTHPGSWHQALKFAGDEALPIIFVHQNQPRNELASLNLHVHGASLKAPSFAFSSITVDGADVVAVYRVASDAIAHARKGNGHTLIECITHGEHFDSIQNMERYLTRKGLYSEEYKAQVTADFSRGLEAAIEAAQGCAQNAAD
jgi:pyruvate dehydrogenase E1 component alpha subunit